MGSARHCLRRGPVRAAPAQQAEAMRRVKQSLSTDSRLLLALLCAVCERQRGAGHAIGGWCVATKVVSGGAVVDAYGCSGRRAPAPASASSSASVLLMSVFLYFHTPDPFSTYVAPRSSHISVDILFLRFSVHHSRLAALLQCAVCERERERAGGAIGWCVGQREVSARGTSATRV